MKVNFNQLIPLLIVGQRHIKKRVGQLDRGCTGTAMNQITSVVLNTQRMINSADLQRFLLPLSAQCFGFTVFPVWFSLGGEEPLADKDTDIFSGDQTVNPINGLIFIMWTKLLQMNDDVAQCLQNFSK